MGRPGGRISEVDEICGVQLTSAPLVKKAQLHRIYVCEKKNVM